MMIKMLGPLCEAKDKHHSLVFRKRCKTSFQGGESEERVRRKNQSQAVEQVNSFPMSSRSIP